MTKKDYYTTLNVSKNASQDEIKSAFREMAKKHHPDRNLKNKEEAEIRFKEIGEAYSVLGTPEKKRQYDAGGSSSSRHNSGGGFSGGGGFDNVNFSDIFSGFEDMFGTSASRGSTRNVSRSGDDLRYVSQITLKDAFYGKEESITFTSLVKCNGCNGTGSKDSKMTECNNCTGRGVVRSQKGFFIMEETCQKCEGTGRIPSAPCKKCNGDGRVRDKKTITFDIPVGIQSDMKIRLSNKGAAGKNGGVNGDLYIEIKVDKHEFLERSGDELVCHVPVKLHLLAVGGKVYIPNIDEEDVELEIPAGTHSNDIFKIKGKGMHLLNSKSKRGNLVVIVDALTPINLTKEQKKYVSEMENMFSDKNYKYKNSLIKKIKSFIKST